MNGPVPPLAAIFALQGRHGIFYVSIGQILQCVQIAAAVGAVPKLPRRWAKANIHRSCIMSVTQAADWRVDPERVVPVAPNLLSPRINLDQFGCSFVERASEAYMFEEVDRIEWVPASDPQPLVKIAGIISLDNFGFCGGEYAFGLDTVNGTETVGLQVILQMLKICEKQAYIEALPTESWWRLISQRYDNGLPEGEFELIKGE